MARLPVLASDNWPQAAGPHGNWQAKGNPPISWSVVKNKNIVWKTTLPEEGQSGIAVWGNRLFLTTMKPLADSSAKKEGADIVGYCLDSRTGKVLWTVDLRGTEESPYAYGFSDSSSPTPVTDGKHVWFVNASGSQGCWDYSGKQVWFRTWKPTTGRPFNKQFEPILYGNTLINMEPRDAGDPKREKDPWNYLRGLDKLTGETLWNSEDALTHYNTPVFGYDASHMPAILMGRGGYHDVPESPSGLSLVSLAPGREGKTIWRYEAPGKALYNSHWDKQYAYWFVEGTNDHQVIDATTGKLLRTQSLTNKVDYRRYNATTGKYELINGINLKTLDPPVSVFPAWFTNIVVNGWHYFLCFTDAQSKVGPPHCVGRVNVETGKVEYLELPVSVDRKPNSPDRLIWGEPQVTSTTNSRGIDVASDPRSKRDGWFWCMLGSPTAVDGKIYITNMLGVTYIIDAGTNNDLFSQATQIYRASTKPLDEKSLLAVNDLGPNGQTWSLNSVSFANGRMYHRSMKEVVCIGGK